MNQTYEISNKTGARWALIIIYSFCHVVRLLGACREMERNEIHNFMGCRAESSRVAASDWYIACSGLGTGGWIYLGVVCNNLAAQLT